MRVMLVVFALVCEDICIITSKNIFFDFLRFLHCLPGFSLIF